MTLRVRLLSALMSLILLFSLVGSSLAAQAPSQPIDPFCSALGQARQQWASMNTPAHRLIVAVFDRLLDHFCVD